MSAVREHTPREDIKPSYLLQHSMPLLPENSSVPVTSPPNASEMRKAWSHPVENVHQFSELSVDALILILPITWPAFLSVWH